MVDGAVSAQPSGTGADRIVFLGHATVLIELDGVRLLTDPLLRRGVAHLRRQVPPVDSHAVADLDAVLISHLHHDHLDLRSLRRLGIETPLVVPAGAGEWLKRRGLAHTCELSAGEHTDVGALTVTAVEAHHDGRRPGGPRAAPVGYLASGRHTVYFAGDTELFDGMANFLPSPDVALVPVAGWGAKLGPGHMGPLEAARAVELMQPQVAIPVHWGTLRPIGLPRYRRRRHHPDQDQDRDQDRDQDQDRDHRDQGRRDQNKHQDEDHQDQDHQDQDHQDQDHRDQDHQDQDRNLSEPPRLFAEHVARLAPSVEVRILAPGQQTVL